MKVLSKAQVLAERNGWSIACAQGFVDGEISRRRGTPPSTYARVGIDDYCLGFRAGYYERASLLHRGDREKKINLTGAVADARQAILQGSGRQKAFEDLLRDGTA